MTNSNPRHLVEYVVDGPVVSDERAVAGAPGEVTGDVGARRAGVLLDDRR
jgi:hypothetical protein